MSILRNIALPEIFRQVDDFGELGSQQCIEAALHFGELLTKVGDRGGVKLVCAIT